MVNESSQEQLLLNMGSAKDKQDSRKKVFFSRRMIIMQIKEFRSTSMYNPPTGFSDAVSSPVFPRILRCTKGKKKRGEGTGALRHTETVDRRGRYRWYSTVSVCIHSSRKPKHRPVFSWPLVSQNQDGHAATSENGAERTMKHLNGKNNKHPGTNVVLQCFPVFWLTNVFLRQQFAGSNTSQSVVC